METRLTCKQKGEVGEGTGGRSRKESRLPPGSRQSRQFPKMTNRLGRPAPGIIGHWSFSSQVPRISCNDFAVAMPLPPCAAQLPGPDKTHVAAIVQPETAHA